MPSLLALGAVAQPTLGHTGCSRLKASVQVRGQALLFRDIDAGSADFCPDHALGLCGASTALLAHATRSSVQGGQPTLYAGRGRLTFRTP